MSAAMHAAPALSGRPWLAAYPPGVPAEAELNKFQSINEVLALSVRAHAGRPAFVSMGRQLTYAELDRIADAFAGYLAGEAGLRPGGRVAIFLPNLLQYPVALFGTLRAGGVVVNCNPLYTPRELARQLRDSGAEIIVAFDGRAHVLAEALADTDIRQVVVTGAGDLLGTVRGPIVNFVMRHVRHAVPPFSIPHAITWREAVRRGGLHAAPLVSPAAADIALLQYTGGTTGVPKGAMLTHGNIVANLQQAHAWITPWLSADQASGASQEVVLTALPLYHIFALTVNCLIFLKIGGRNVLVADPRDIPGLVRTMRRHPVTVLTGVNTLFNALLENAQFRSLDFSGLRMTLGGGMAVQQAVAERWRSVTGKPVIEAYGLSEASPGVAVNRLDIENYTGAIGLPLPSTEVAIRDDLGADLPPGDAGELCVRGPQIMAGYWRRPDETAKVMTADGFLRTGDVARMEPSGLLHIVDRKKDMIICGGFNVYPSEIEDVVARHPGVVEVGAVGIPDPASGEVVGIVVVRRSEDLTAEVLVAHCREFLTGYKIPKRVVFAEELPKTAIGKHLRRELRRFFVTDASREC